MSYPQDNPKAAIGAKKIPLHLVPPALMIGAAEAMADGARKYGPYNFRDSGIAASVYMGAIERHLFSWWDGEDNTRDSNIHHLKAIAADIGLMLDAMAKGTFVDDRPTTGGAADLIDEWDRRHDGRDSETRAATNGTDELQFSAVQTRQKFPSVSCRCGGISLDPQYAHNPSGRHDV